jgi:hypothetical protein
MTKTTWQLCHSFDVNSNTQKVACNGGFVGITASLVNSKTQNTACQSSGCLNNGINTNIYANSASDICRNIGSDTTTICQGDRTFVFPNH